MVIWSIQHLFLLWNDFTRSAMNSWGMLGTKSRSWNDLTSYWMEARLQSVRITNMWIGSWRSLEFDKPPDISPLQGMHCKMRWMKQVWDDKETSEFRRCVGILLIFRMGFPTVNMWFDIWVLVWASQLHMKDSLRHLFSYLCGTRDVCLV